MLYLRWRCNLKNEPSSTCRVWKGINVTHPSLPSEYVSSAPKWKLAQGYNFSGHVYGQFKSTSLIVSSSISVQCSSSVVSDSLRPHGLQRTRPLCPSPTPGAYSDSCPLSRWCHPAISSSVVPFSCLQSFLASGSFTTSQLFTSGGQSISNLLNLLNNIQDWFPLGWTGWITLQSKGLTRVFSNTTVQKHQFFSAHIHVWPLEKP